VKEPDSGTQLNCRQMFKKNTDRKGGGKKKKKNIHVQQEVYKWNEILIMVGGLRGHQNPPELDVEGPPPPLPLAPG